MTVTTDRAALLDKVKTEVHPKIVREAKSGDKGIDPLRFQPVRSPGLFEAEFAQRGEDVIFHFWPWGLHQADKESRPRPAFPPGFKSTLSSVLTKAFAPDAIKVEDDRDMGAIFVRVVGLGSRQFWRDLTIKAVTDLHHALGGE